MRHPDVLQRRPSWLACRPNSVAGIWLLPLVLGLLAACASTGATGQSFATATEPTHASLPTYTPAPTPLAITDLGQFRTRLSSGMTSGKWAQVAPLLSPAFSFQGLNGGSGRLELPASAQDFQKLYNSTGSWGQSQDPVNFLFCAAGSTPKSQQMGFVGGDGSWVLVGMARWQGYWVAAWAFQDPIGAAGGCA